MNDRKYREHYQRTTPKKYDEGDNHIPIFKNQFRFCIQKSILNTEVLLSCYSKWTKSYRISKKFDPEADDKFLAIDRFPIKDNGQLLLFKPPFYWFVL